MRKRIIALFSCTLASCLIINGCRKHEDEPKCPPIPDCEPTPQSNSAIGYDYLTEGTHLNTTSFNPNNDDEFVYWAYSDAPRISPTRMDTLFVYNKATGEKRNIFEGQIAWATHWGKNGWILFNSYSGIATIKPNGDSLRIISQSYFRPAWNASCTRIYASSSNNMNVLLNLDGTVADSFEFGAGDVDFIDDDRFLAGHGIFTISTRQYNPIAEGWGTGCRMISADEFIWWGNFEINKTNIVTQQTVKLKETTCKSQAYLEPSVNASRTKVLWTTVKYHADTCLADKLYSDYEIVEINTDGSDEREIGIPE